MPDDRLKKANTYYYFHDVTNIKDLDFCIK